jgi:hypothetical protein
MSYNTQLAHNASNAACNAVTALCNSGYLKVYTGSQPAAGDSTITGTLLATINLPSAAFAGASNGTANLNATLPATAGNTGTAGYFVILKNDNSTPVLMGSVGTASCNLNLGSTSISSGAQVSITSYTFSINEAGS